VFSKPNVIPIIIKDLNRRTSKVSVTKNFNSNERGNNRRVEATLERAILALSAATSLENKIKILLSCNFKEDWLLEEIVPKAKVEPPLDLLEQISDRENILIRSCLKLAVGLASTMRGRVELEDAIQQANIALIDAAKKYNPNRNTRFVTYAHQKIRWRLQLDQWDDPRDIIRIPRNRPKSSRTPWLSLDEDADFIRSRKLQDVIPNDEHSIERSIEESMAKSKLKKEIIRVLDATELEIIRLRYLSGRILTYEEVKQSLTKDMSKQRIAQLETTALEKLRKSGLIQELYEVFK
jgi:RNA polymerase sigma factor (sigma-70 family)